MSHVADHHEPSPWYASFDCSGMGVNIRNISIPDYHKSRDANLLKSRQRRFGRELQLRMSQVLRTRRENLGHSLLGSIIPRRNQKLVLSRSGNGARHVAFFERPAQHFTALQKMFRVRHAANDCADQHKLLNDVRIVQGEVNGDFPAMRAATIAACVIFR